MMTVERTKPFNDLPDLPPAAELETKAVLKKCIGARSALAELKGLGDLIPNQALLVRSIGLQEARVSSEIENIVTTTDNLYQALADSIDKADSASKEVVQYQDALAHGLQAIQRQPILSTNLFCELASIIKRRQMNVRNVPGTKIVDGRNKVIYTPPEGADLIRRKLANLETYIHSDSGVDPLIKLAVMHYQFESIHPFTDGNGRTGRIINILYLVQQELLHLPILYLSKYFIEHKSDYYAGLRAVTEESAWEQWILFVLDAIQETSKGTATKILEIRDAMEETTEKMRKSLPAIYSRELVELLFYHPYCKIKFVEEKVNVGRQTAATYLRSLENIGILDSVKAGREVYFINKRLLGILRS